MHMNGDRVLVLRDDYWYPGTIRHIDKHRFFVICDDGEDGFFEPLQLADLKLGVGETIYVKLPMEVDFQKSRIVDLREDSVQVKRSDEAPLWVPLGQVRLAPRRAAAPSSSSASPSSSTDITERPAAHVEHVHEIGARVWACGLDLFWYPGVVLGENDGSWRVLFDFGGHALVPFGQAVPLTYEVGDRILCRWQAGNEFFAGTITRKEGEIVDLHYDDGDEETTSIRLARVEHDDWLPAAEAYELGPGDRVLGCWFDRFWYPGIILSMIGKRIHVLFDDNDQAYLTWDRIRPLEVEVGDRILCRLKGGAFYLPGEVVRKKDERIFVKYDDGQEEWTSVRLLRLERPSTSA